MFDEQISAVCGLNGSGKTNLLDAIYYLCFTKSYLGLSDSASVKQGLLGFHLNGEFQKGNDLLPVSVILRENGKKELLVDKEPVSPFSAHIGRLPVVFVAPDDVVLITGGSEERRRFIDTILSQKNSQYLTQLIRYNKCLLERNKYLKSSVDGRIDHLLLDTFDNQLVQFGTYILKERLIFMEDFIPLVRTLFAFISDDAEQPDFMFLPSSSPDNYLRDLQNQRQKDILLQRTLTGVHRDDLEITLNGMPFKQIASQGQKKSLLFAIKLAEFSILKNHFGFEPLLLLDDIFEKLDQKRLHMLLNWVCVKNSGQVIMSDTHPERIQQALNEIGVSFNLIKPEHV